MRIRSFHQRFLLSRYLLRAHIGPFLFSFCTLMFLFLLQFVMKFIDQLVGKGLSSWVIIELVILNLSWMFVLAVPMSVLVATLMAFGELSSRNEITAMKAGGASIYRMMGPPLLAGLVVGLLLVWFNNHVLPESNHRLKTLMMDIHRKKPTLSLVNGVFSQEIQGYSILVRKTFEKTNDLEGVTLYDYTNPDMNVVITADRGTILFSSDYRRIVMDLADGEINELDLRNMNLYRRIRFRSHRIVMNVEGFDFERSAESAFQRSDRELSAQAMVVIVDSLVKRRDGYIDGLRQKIAGELKHELQGATDGAVAPMARFPQGRPSEGALYRSRILGSVVATDLSLIESVDKQIDQYRVEINKKYSIPAACLIFVLVGAPLGIMSRRGGFGIAATLSLGFFVLYWACLIGGEKLADRDILSPFLGMWMANFIIGIMGAYMTIRVGRETVTINWSIFQRLVPKRWQTRLAGEDDAGPTEP